MLAFSLVYLLLVCLFLNLLCLIIFNLKALKVIILGNVVDLKLIIIFSSILLLVVIYVFLLKKYFK